MSKYKGIVREIYEYEIDIDAEDGAEAIEKLKRLHDKDNTEGVFVADANTYLRAEYSLRSRLNWDLGANEDVHKCGRRKNVYGLWHT